MSFWIMLIIVVFAGVLGGYVNYLLPANNPEPGKYISPLRNCIFLGLGAVFLVPLFLEIAQSKLLDDINFSWKWIASDNDSTFNSNTAPYIRDSITVTTRQDSAGKMTSIADTSASSVKKTTWLQHLVPKSNSSNSGKNYFLWGAYCLLSAAAGFRFINMLINNVVKEDQLKEQKNKIGELEKVNEKREKNSQISQQEEEKKIRGTYLEETFKSLTAKGDFRDLSETTLPTLPAISVPTDPQKGRFGGQSLVNDRKLSAQVIKSNIPQFYKVTITVESTNPKNPLTTDVIFYLHDSFSPSIYTIKPAEFKDGKAVDDEILSYGAFTVGVITDNGKTLLELDLAEDKSFPKLFRER